MPPSQKPTEENPTAPPATEEKGLFEREVVVAPEDEEGKKGTEEETDADDTTEGDDEDDKSDVSDKLARARGRTEKGEGESEPDRVDRLEKTVADLATMLQRAFGKPTAQNPDGDPNLPWDQEGSAQNPPSWRALLNKAAEEGEERGVRRVVDMIQREQQEQGAADDYIEQQIGSLKEEGLLADRAEERELLEVARKYGQPDLYKAYELMNDLREAKGEERKDRTKEANEQRKDILRKSNKRSTEPGLPAAPEYKKLRIMSMDQIVKNALRNVGTRR